MIGRFAILEGAMHDFLYFGRLRNAQIVHNTL
jgi:hypothetical protein